MENESIFDYLLDYDEDLVIKVTRDDKEIDISYEDFFDSNRVLYIVSIN